MNEDMVFIPTNYTDAGKLFGLFALRNVLECAVLCLPLLLLCVGLSPFGLTGTILLCTAVTVPVGGFALAGIRDFSLFTFWRLVRRHRKNARILIYRGSTWIRKKSKPGSGNDWI